MTWLLFALLAPVFWALSNLVDQYLVQQVIRKPLALVVITGLFSGFPSLYLLVKGAFIWPGLPLFLFITLTSVVALMVYLPYYEAIEHAPATAIVPLWNFIPVFTLILAAVFVQESLQPLHELAIALLIGSALVASVKSHHLRVSWKAIGLMIIASFLCSLEYTWEKAIYQRLPFEQAFAWLSGSFFATALLIMCVSPSVRKSIRHHLRRSFVLINVTNEGFDFLGSLFTNLAISLGSVSLVSGIEKLQPLFVLLFLSLFYLVRGRHKKITRDTIRRVCVSVAMALIAMILITHT